MDLRRPTSRYRLDQATRPMGSNFHVRPGKPVVPLCLSLIDLLQAEVHGSPVYVANDEVDSMIQEASELLDPALRFDWLQHFRLPLVRTY